DPIAFEQLQRLPLELVGAEKLGPEPRPENAANAHWRALQAGADEASLQVEARHAAQVERLEELADVHAGSGSSTTAGPASPRATLNTLPLSSAPRLWRANRMAIAPLKRRIARSVLWGGTKFLSRTWSATWLRAQATGSTISPPLRQRAVEA